ncbi:MAG: hypothetical protein ACE5HI_19540 [bacterium]
MANLWDDIAKTIREGVDTVVEKTEELTRIGKIRVDIINIKRNIEKNFSELGGKAYHLMTEEKKIQIADDKEVKEVIECIKILEKELQNKKLELEKIKTKEEVKDKSTATTKPTPKPKTEAKTTSKSTRSTKSSAAKPKAKAAK